MRGVILGCLAASAACAGIAAEPGGTVFADMAAMAQAGTVSSATIIVEPGRWCADDRGLRLEAGALAGTVWVPSEAILGIDAPVWSQSRVGALQLENGRIAQVSTDGRYAAVVEVARREQMLETSVTYYDDRGRERWKKYKIALFKGIWIAPNGARVAWVESSINGCAEHSPRCAQSIVVVDDRGLEVARVGPYWVASLVAFAANGDLGMGFGELFSGEAVYVFFDARTGKVIQKGTGEFRVRPGILDTGDVVEDQYGRRNVRFNIRMEGTR